MLYSSKWYYGNKKELWNWLANHPGAFKENWPGWKNITETILTSCLFLYKDESDCPYCLFNAQSGSYTSGRDLYTLWHAASDMYRDNFSGIKNLVVKLATQISEEGGKNK